MAFPRPSTVPIFSAGLLFSEYENGDPNSGSAYFRPDPDDTSNLSAVLRDMIYGHAVIHLQAGTTVVPASIGYFIVDELETLVMQVTPEMVALIDAAPAPGAIGWVTPATVTLTNTLDAAQTINFLSFGLGVNTNPFPGGGNAS